MELDRRNWENITNIIKETAEGVGQKKVSKQRNHNIPKVQELSEKQKKIRIHMSSMTDPHIVMHLRKSRNKILKEIKQASKEEREKRIDKVVENIEKSSHNDNMMFKAVKNLQREKKENLYVHNTKGEVCHRG